MGKMKAVVVQGPGKVAVKDIDIPSPGPYEALVKLELVAICNSTDTKIVDGRFPGIKEYPTTLGHEGVGAVVAIGDRVRSYSIGDRVLNPLTMRTNDRELASAWGTLAEYALAGDHAAMRDDGVCDAEHGYDGVFETQKVIPADIPSRQAILLSTWREVYSAFPEFDLRPGSSVLIIGGGPVGLSFLAIAKALGFGLVCLATHSEWKLQKARSLGADVTFAAGDDLVRMCRQQLPKGFDVVVDAVGSPQVMNQALQLVEFNGVIGVYGTVPDGCVSLDVKHAPYNWKLVFHQWPDYTKEAAAHDPLCELVRAQSMSSDQFITHELPFDEVIEAFAAVRNNAAIKVVLRL